MANEEHVSKLKQGVEAWNAWRSKTLRSPLAMSKQKNLHRVDLRGTNLRKANLRGAKLYGADLSEADLSEADLSEAVLSEAVLSGAVLSGADLRRADLSWAHLANANLSRARLDWTDLRRADLRGANLGEAELYGTVLADTDLSKVRGLETCDHQGPSIIDYQTLEKAGPLPLVFLRGIGLPDNLIDYLPSLLNRPFEFYSCFISYSSKDQEFADRLHADLQNKGVRCWFAPHDLPIGAKTWDTINEAIRLRDKVLLILSENAIASDWVEDEVSKAFAEERERKQIMLFPIRLDDGVMQTEEAWARKLRDQRNIGSFIGWKDHDTYQRSFERVLRDLKVAQPSKI